MKTRIDRDTRTLLLKYVKKYDEYAEWYQEERERILNPGRRAPDGTPGSGRTGDPTALGAERLERLEGEHRAKVVRAIDKAKKDIGQGFAAGEQERLRQAVWLSCRDARQYNFEAFEGEVACERRQFYYYKNEFLDRVRAELGI